MYSKDGLINLDKESIRIGVHYKLNYLQTYTYTLPLSTECVGLFKEVHEKRPSVVYCVANHYIIIVCLCQKWNPPTYVDTIGAEWG